MLNQKLLKCKRYGSDVNPNEDTCSKHTSASIFCAICGRELLKEGSIIDGDRIICGECLNAMGTCAVCRNGNSCAFETDPSSLPKIVQKQIRQGNMTSVVQIKNPDRVEITCKKYCPCFSPENGCLKQSGVCDKYDEI